VVKPLVFSQHARTALGERELLDDWIERAVREPEWESVDPADSGVVRRYRSIAELGGRVLRVVCVEMEEEIRVVTAFLDRRARRPE
jgi:hypothetical protein